MSAAKSARQGWIVVFGSLILMSAFMGIVNNCYALFIIPVTESLGFSRSAYSVCQTLNYLFCMLSSAVSWRLYRRFGLVRTVQAACLVLIGFYFLYSRATALPVFYLISCVVGLCMGLTITAAIPILVKSWFREKYSMAIGIAMMGSGVGGMIFNPLAQMLMERFGWRMTYVVLSAVMAVLVLPVVFGIFRENRAPAPHGEEPAGRSQADAPRSARGRKSAVMGLIFLMALCCTVLFYTITPYLQDIGYTARFASVCASVTMAVLAVGKVLEGGLLDRLSLRTCTFLSLLFMAVGLTALVFLRTPFLLLFVWLGIFLGCPYITVAVSAVAASISSCPEEENASTGHLTAIVNLGSALSPVLAGFIFDAASSYVPLFIGAAVLVLLALFAVRPLIPGKTA